MLVSASCTTRNSAMSISLDKVPKPRLILTFTGIPLRSANPFAKLRKAAAKPASSSKVGCK